jgi:hypothetical protein
VKEEGKGEIKPEHLEILLRLGRERVVRRCEISQQEIKSLQCWLDSGMIIKNIGKNCDEPLEDEVHYILTDKGEEYCLNYNRIFD